MANVLADMVLRLGMDSAEIRKGLKTVESELSRFNKSVSGMKRALQGAFAVTGAAVAVNEIKNLVLAGTQAADQVGKLSRVAGASVEDFSRMAYAAKMADLDTADFAQSLGLLSKKIADAASGGKSAAMFEQMGIAIRDANGQIRPTAALLSDIAAKFQSYEDGAAKTALAMELFGKSGAKMLPLLNGGAGGLAQMQKEADRLGFTLDAKTAEAADKFNDALDNLRIMGDRLGAAIGAELAGTVDALAQSMATGASQADAYNEAAKKIAFTVRTLTGMLLYADNLFQRVGRGMAAYAATAVAVAKGEFVEAKYYLDLYARELEQLNKKYGAQMDALGFTADGGYNPPKAEKPPPGAETDPRRGRGYNYKAGFITGEVPAVREPGGEAAAKSKREKQGFTGWDAIAYEGYSKAATLADTPIAGMDRWQMDLDALNASEKNPVVDDILGDRAKFDEELAARNEALTEFAKQAQANMQNLLGDQLGDVLTGEFKGGLDEMLTAWGKMLARMAAQAVAANILGAIFGTATGGAGGGIFGGLFSGIFGGGKAVGGPVTAGTTYLVGERGPELFTPRSTGAIVPNHALATAAAPISVSLSIPSIDPGAGLEFVRRNIPKVAAEIVSAVQREQKAGRA